MICASVEVKANTPMAVMIATTTCVSRVRRVHMERTACLTANTYVDAVGVHEGRRRKNRILTITCLQHGPANMAIRLTVGSDANL